MGLSWGNAVVLSFFSCKMHVITISRPAKHGGVRYDKADREARRHSFEKETLVC